MGLFTTSFSFGPGLRAVVGYPFQLYTLSTWLVNVVDCIGGSSLIISSSSFLSRTRTSPSFFNICYEPWSIFSWALNKENFGRYFRKIRVNKLGNYKVANNESRMFFINNYNPNPAVHHMEIDSIEEELIKFI